MLEIKNCEIKLIFEKRHCFCFIVASHGHPKVFWVDFRLQPLECIERILSHWKYIFHNSTCSYLFTFKGEVLQEEASCCIRVVVLDNLVLSGDFLSHLIKEFTNMFTSVKVFEWMEADRLAWYAILLMLQTVLRLHGWSENTSFRHFCRRSILFETCKWYQDICVVSATDGLSSLWVKDNYQFEYEGQFICRLDKLELYQYFSWGRVDQSIWGKIVYILI